MTGILASGSHFRVTAHEVRIWSPDGALHRHTMTHDLIGVRRVGNTIIARDIHGRSFDMLTASEPDAVAIEQLLLLTVPSSPAPARARVEISSATIGIAACVVLAIATLVYYVVTDDELRQIFWPLVV